MKKPKPQIRRINWKISNEDRILRDAVVERSSYEYPHHPRQTVEMDLTATHLNGCPLDFAKLLAFGGTDFTHDIFGINRHISHRTGELMGHFRPWCAK